MKLIVLVLLMMTGFSVTAQNSINVVPAPANLKMGKGSFSINKDTKIIVSKSTEKFADLVVDFIFNNYGLKLFKLKTTDFTKKDNNNSITFSPSGLKYGSAAGAYTLEITNNGILIGGGTDQGIFYGIQTLFQLLPANSKNYPLSIPQLSITDYPRFKYRGMHLDVGRHFFPVSFIKKYIDYLAAYKFNTFHWHLTEDQGWRIEIKKYPLLTSVGGYRNGTIIGRYPGKGNDSTRYGGFYTQEEIKEVVKYATDRYIEVIPEIEMPGHSSAAIAAYPQLSCFPDESTKPGKTPWAGTKEGKQVQQTWGVFEDVFCPSDYTFNFLQDVLDEVMPLFPSKYIHIGGDECPKEAWKRSAFCQQLIKDNNLKDEHGLQSYFIQRIEKYINSKGKQIIGWDEILEGGLAPNATVMSWRGEEGGIAAAKQNHDVIMTPGSNCYLDHSQTRKEDSVTIGGYLPLENVYNYEPVPAVLNAEQAKHILGAQGNVWTEYMAYPSKVEYMIFPRMLALSEVLWSPKEKRSWKDFESRLPALLERLDKKKVNYSKAYYDLQAMIVPAADNNGITLKLESKDQHSIIKYEILPATGKAYTYSKPVPIAQNTTISAWSETGTTKSTRINQSFKFNKATGKKITLINEPAKNYPGDGAFTLVNGIQNELGLAKGTEFLGFLGKDCEGQIEFGKPEKIRKVRFHILNQNGSWIYPPKSIEVSFAGSLTAKRLLRAESPIENKDGNIIYEIDFGAATEMTVLNFKIINLGIIPEGNPGAGNPAWLFVDEIEAE